jgi:hypothetical protein
MAKTTERLDAILGQSVIAAMITGVAAVVAAIFAFIQGDWVGTGVCLGAAGLAFGLLANAMMRD